MPATKGREELTNTPSLTGREGKMCSFTLAKHHPLMTKQDEKERERRKHRGWREGEREKERDRQSMQNK